MNADSEKMEPMEWAKFVLRNRNEKGYARAYNIFVTRAREGDADAEYNLGMMYARGQGVPKDYDAALSWFQKAHDGGNRGATYFLGKMYATGVGVQKDSRAAERMFLKCADEDVRAQYEIGLLYFRDEDIPRDLERSAKWMLRAANNGHAEAQFMVGQFYKAGAGVPKDMGKAVEWLTSAALNRHPGQHVQGRRRRRGRQGGIRPLVRHGRRKGQPQEALTLLLARHILPVPNICGLFISPQRCLYPDLHQYLLSPKYRLLGFSFTYSCAYAYAHSYTQSCAQEQNL